MFPVVWKINSRNKTQRRKMNLRIKKKKKEKLIVQLTH